MRSLASVLLVFAVLAPTTAIADTHMVRGAQVLSVPSPYATPASPYHGLFLRLHEKVDGQTQASEFAFEKSFERIRYFRGEKAVEIVPGEGCGKHPVEWLYKAKAIGWFKKKLPALLLVQVPEDAKIIAAPAVMPVCPENGQMLASTVVRTSGGELAYLVCSGDLNARLQIMRRDQGTWTAIDAFTVTDDCP